MAAVPNLPPHPAVLNCEELLRLTGFQRVADMQRCLDEQGVRYFKGRGGELWTTVDLLNAAGGLSNGAKLPAANEPYHAQSLFP